MRIPFVVAPLVLGLSACVTNPSNSVGSDIDIARALSGQSQVHSAALDKAIRKASAYPLGSKKNPVRAHFPQGQQAYLARLRCANGEMPSFARRGQGGMSPYGNIVDIYDVICPGSTPAKAEIYIDMYHSGNVEDQAVEGFTIVSA